MQIGSCKLANPLIAAPMAGVTDRPFRLLCRELGAALTVSEMVTSQQNLWHTEKTRLRLDHRGEADPVTVQIAGTEPARMAQAARFNVQHGAQIIDINMGCPAKKVCNVAAGSALMKDERRVAAILQTVVEAVEVPVTLKIRTGWNRQQRNAVTIARIAEDCGIAAVTVHGRTREDKYTGMAEYDTIASVKSFLQIPVIANGDIDSPQKAQTVLQYTGADGLMIGRAAQGRPWIFREIDHYLKTGTLLPPPAISEIKNLLLRHIANLHDFYGETRGVRIARKHIGWYCNQHAGARLFKQAVNRIENAQQQIDAVAEFFNRLETDSHRHDMEVTGQTCKGGLAA